MHPLFPLLQQLDAAHYSYALARHRPDTICVTINFVGERAEIDVFDDGHMEVSRFIGTEAIVGGSEIVQQLINENLIRDRNEIIHVPDDIAYRTQQIDDLERHVAMLRSQLLTEFHAK